MTTNKTTEQQLMDEIIDLKKQIVEANKITENLVVIHEDYLSTEQQSLIEKAEEEINTKIKKVLEEEVAKLQPYFTVKLKAAYILNYTITPFMCGGSVIEGMSSVLSILLDNLTKGMNGKQSLSVEGFLNFLKQHKEEGKEVN